MSEREDEMVSVQRLDLETDMKIVEWLRLVFPDCPQVCDDLVKTLSKNPGRISRAYRALLEGYLIEPETILTVTREVPGRDYCGLVSSIQMPFLSFCAHHFLPYFGTVDLVYEPGEYIIGIGKISRLVECRAKRFEIQEDLVMHICQNMMEFAKAKGVYVQSSARHTCVCYRGPEMHMTVNKTSYAMGSLANSIRMQEIFAALQAPHASSI